MAVDMHSEVFRAVYDSLVEPAPATLDWAELEARVAEAPALPRRRTRWQLPVDGRARRWAWIVATAAIALALVGGFAILLRGGEDIEPPVITRPVVSTTLPSPTTSLPPATTTPSTTATTTPTTLAESAGLMDWELASVPSLLNEYRPDGLGEIMNTVVGSADGWVAAGTTAYNVISGETSDPGWVAAFWTSPDGREWERVPHDDDVFGGADNYYVVSDITAGGPGYVAVGHALDREGYDLTSFAEYVVWGMGSDYQDAAVWVSEDGSTWSRVSSEGLGGPGWQIMTGVTSGDSGLLAVGLVQDEEGSALWTSVDGSDWQRVDPNPFRGTNVWSISTNDQGYLASGNIDFQPTIWQSQDGIDWTATQLTEPGTDIRGEAQGVVRFGDTIIAAGFAAGDVGMGDHVAGIWTSSDAGETWDQVPPFTSTVRQTDLFGLVADNNGLVAGGQQYDWNDPDWARTAIWVSRDGGAIWEKVPHQDEVFGGYGETAMKLFSLAAYDGTYVGVGAMRGDPAAWVGVWSG
ncbi:MAG: anti-sigma factor [Acidimicrobiia bacterium]|nr:anti-sigma factor [Acidimicrobiia bacterium]